MPRTGVGYPGDRIDHEKLPAHLLRNGWQDMQYGLRSLRANPGFTTAVVLTLALGIGANTAIFSVVNAVILRPLPYPGAERLVRVWESNPDRELPLGSVSYPNFADWRERTSSFERIAAFVGASFNFTAEGSVERVSGNEITADLLPLLGVTPALGRNIAVEEERLGGNNRVVLVSHRFWHRHFGADAAAVGETLVLDENRYQVVGVLPEAFAWGGGSLDLFVPLVPRPDRDRQNRSNHMLSVVGRLKHGVGLDRAIAEMELVASRLAEQYPESNKGFTVRLRTFYDWLVPEEARRTLLVFAGAAGFVLLIACTNVANLVLARGTSRQRELSIRVALGATRFRIVSQLLIESLLLALIGGVAGLFAGLASIELLGSASAGDLVSMIGVAPDGPRLELFKLDERVLAFAALITLVTGVVFGLAPAIRASRPDLNETLKEGSRGSGGAGARLRLRGMLVTAEVAVSVTLLIGAGLLLRSLWSLRNVDPGFQPANLLTLRVNLPAPRYSSLPASASFYEQALAGLADLPGVRAAAATSSVPMSGGNTGMEIVVDGRPGATPHPAAWRIASPGYFRTLGVSLRGRDFTQRDTGEPPGQFRSAVAIVSAEMARRYWSGEDPIGKTFQWGPVRQTIVGVAGDVRNLGLELDPPPLFYLPLATTPTWANPMMLVVRTDDDPMLHASAVRAAIRAVDPSVPVDGVAAATEIIGNTLGSRRFTTLLVASFATLALVLAGVGLFAVMAYVVAQRTHDLGVRLALGARPRDIFRLVIGQGMRLALFGSAIGVMGAFWLSRELKSLLFAITERDPLTFVAIPLFLLSTALLACYVPARRAMSVDPLAALRHE